VDLARRLGGWAVLSLAIVLCVAPARGAEAPRVSIHVGATERICQLTGEFDWETNRPTAARTESRFGLEAVDLGFPVEHRGRLFFLFGDAWPTPPGPVQWVPNDGVGVTSRVEPPDPEHCLDLVVNSKLVGFKNVYRPATIIGPKKVKQGAFNVPTGGVSVQDSLYAFFWTDHCVFPNLLLPSPDQPLELPPATRRCPEAEGNNSVGRGVMARSVDGGRTFTDVVPMPQGFVYSMAVNTNLIPGLPAEQRRGVLVFGVPRFRASVPYLAFAPEESFADTSTWRFFTGLEPDGSPRLVGSAAWRPSRANQIYQPLFEAGNNVGELSMTWNRPLHLWIMMYDGVAMRVARAPWGPWSAPATVLGAEALEGCKLVMAPHGCPGHRDYWPALRRGDDFEQGHFYAPFVLNRYTSPGEEPNSTTLYWLLSTWNPYQVSVMRTTIRAEGNR